ncbi:hypothetical protein [Novipirellula rosea]|uniref:hypothetical protein n=1 Tax=Novipirellula rosea TaxID=1031540 RepID=UPI0031E6F765
MSLKRLLSRTSRFAILIVVFLSPTSSDAGSPTGWSPIILPTGSYRAEIKAMPIHQRPGRPLHVYGNTVRLIERMKRSRGFYRPLRQIVFGTDDLAETLTSR